MPRPLAQQVVVVTGASSGIGKEAARMLGSHGAAVVLVARGETALHEAAAEVEARGGKALAVAADVSDAAQMQGVADRAAAHFGRIDTWVNNAGVAAYGTVDQMTVEEIRRIIEVDLLGTIHGVKAALPYLRQSGGTLVNVASVASRLPTPLLAAYSAAKHGVLGFTDALRMELDHEGAGVAVTAILPYGINTPFFNHARSKLGVMPRPTPPAYPPSAVAEAIVWAAEHPTREIVVGGAGKSVLLMRRLSPVLVDKVMTLGGLAFRMQRSNRPDDGLDNLFAPVASSAAAEGDYGKETLLGNGYARTFEFHPMRQRLVVAATLLALTALVRQVGRR